MVYNDVAKVFWTAYYMNFKDGQGLQRMLIFASQVFSVVLNDCCMEILRLLQDASFMI